MFAGETERLDIRLNCWDQNRRCLENTSEPSVQLARHIHMDIAEMIMLQEITDIPDCDDRRLVYADWLAERGDVRAEFLRLEVELETSYRNKGVSNILIALRKLAHSIADPDWQLKVTYTRLSQLVLAW